VKRLCFFVVAFFFAAAPVFAQKSSAGKQPPAVAAKAALISNADRAALTFRSYDFEVHLEPAQHSMAARVRMAAKNSSDAPLTHIALQLSGALHWEEIRVNGHTAKFHVETVASDIDHTGELTEAVMALPAPLAPHAQLSIEAFYSGTIQPSAERLLRLGAPAKLAAGSEWDRITPELTALRGFGNVIWFPVSTAPVLLGQGSEMFDSVGQWKRREANATITMRVMVESTGAAPTVAVLNGLVVSPDSKSADKPAAPNPASNTIPQVTSFTLPPAALGFTPLSLFVLSAPPLHSPNLDIYATQPDVQNAANFQAILEQDRPLVEQWLGTHPKRPVVLVDLGDPDELPFETRNVLFLPMRAKVDINQMGPVLAHMLGHSWFVSERPWLDEGVAQFMTLLWIEQRAGRAAAIQEMDAHRAALALAETSDPGANPGQSLVNAWSDIYYRNKAADVLWMLRDIAGDTALSAALTAYDPAKDTQPGYFQSLLEKFSKKDLEWFFDDWVYRDRGLPDLVIVSAYSRPILTRNNSIRNYLVSVDVRNDSFCAAEVPVTAESALTTQTRRLLVPAHGHASVRMLLDSKPMRVTVNDGSVPEVRSSEHEAPIVPAQ
jgi:hypothetical protein